VIIEQAQGVLAQQFGLGMDPAFDRLRRFARCHNLRLVEVALQVVTGELNMAPARDSISGNAGPVDFRRGQRTV
jgi:hypothetical protein